MKRFDFFSGMAYIIDRNTDKIVIKRKNDEPAKNSFEIMIEILEENRDFLQNSLLEGLRRFKVHEIKKNYSLKEEKKDNTREILEGLPVFSPFKNIRQ